VGCSTNKIVSPHCKLYQTRQPPKLRGDIPTDLIRAHCEQP
jgi:hypothetical protein